MNQPQSAIPPQLVPRQVDLHRQVCTIRPDRIDIRPARSLVILPALGLALGLAGALGIWFGMALFPMWLLSLLLVLALLLLPISAMGLVYAVVGTNTIIDRIKQSATFQQGVFGLGLGTQELVPFWKMVEYRIEDVSEDRLPGDVPRDFAHYEITLLKTSGRRLKLGSVVVPRSLAAEGLARAREVAEAIGTLTGKPVRLPELALVASGGQRRPRRRRLTRSGSPRKRPPPPWL